MSIPRTGDFASVKTRSLQLENTDGTQPAMGSVLNVNAAGVAGWTRGPEVDTLTARGQIVLMDGETHSGALSYSSTQGLMFNGSSITGGGSGMGHTGHTGPQGNTGHTGPQGNTGDQGHTGHTGPQGPIGPSGEQGHTGHTGPQGNTGHTGPQGPLGPSGEQGHTGHTGPKGDSTITGVTGGNGITVSGPTGDCVIAWSGSYSGTLSLTDASLNIARDIPYDNRADTNLFRAQVSVGGESYVNRLYLGSYGNAGSGVASSIQATRIDENIGVDLLINPIGGNVGFGTSVPNAKLDVSGGAYIRSTANVGGSLKVGGLSVPTQALDVAGNAIFSGNVGVGTTTPSIPLDVSGTAKITSAVFGPGGAADINSSVTINNRLMMKKYTNSSYNSLLFQHPESDVGPATSYSINSQYYNGINYTSTAPLTINASPLNINGTTSLGGATTVTSGGLTVTAGGATINGGNLTVASGTTSLGGKTTVTTGGLEVNGATSLGGQTTVTTGGFTVNSNLPTTLMGNTYINNTFNAITPNNNVILGGIYNPITTTLTIPGSNVPEGITKCLLFCSGCFNLYLSSITRQYVFAYTTSIDTPVTIKAQVGSGLDAANDRWVPFCWILPMVEKIDRNKSYTLVSTNLSDVVQTNIIFLTAQFIPLF